MKHGAQRAFSPADFELAWALLPSTFRDEWYGTEERDRLKPLVRRVLVDGEHAKDVGNADPACSVTRLRKLVAEVYGQIYGGVGYVYPNRRAPLPRFSAD